MLSLFLNTKSSPSLSANDLASVKRKQAISEDMASCHQVSKSAVLFSPHLLPLDWIGWYSFWCVSASVPVGILPSLASSALSSSAASASPFWRDLPFYTIQMLPFHILKSIRAEQVNIHIPPPSTLLFMFHSRPSRFENSCLRVWSPLSCLSCSPECVKYGYCSGRNNKTETHVLLSTLLSE